MPIAALMMILSGLLYLWRNPAVGSAGGDPDAGRSGRRRLLALVAWEAGAAGTKLVHGLPIAGEPNRPGIRVHQEWALTVPRRSQLSGWWLAGSRGPANHNR